jgi:hypothetical protein
MHTELWSGNLRGRDHSEDLGIDGRMILKWILNKLVWFGFIWLGIWTSGDCSHHGNEPSGSVKSGE